MTVIHTVLLETTDHGEALAIRDILRDLGYEATVQSRKLEITVSPMRDTRLGRLVLRSMLPKRSYHLDDIAEVLVNNEYAPTSAGVVLSKLADEGDIVRIDRGRYCLKNN